MKLERIKIEGYRSLKSVEWKPAPLNVLIGANASGKSNFLQALELLPAAADGELKDLVLRRGGMYPLLWEGEANRIYLESVFRAETQRPTYAIALDRLSESAMYEISMERVCAEDQTVLLDRTFSEMAGASKGSETILSSRLSPGEEPIPFAVKQAIRSWGIYQNLRTDSDSEVRKSAITRSEKYLDKNGHNLVSVLFTLYNSDARFEEDVDDAMAAAFPNDYEKLKFTPLEDGRVWLRVRWRNGKRQPTTADLSDGTLRFLMLLTILANPEPPPLVAIDEPETGLHPRMLSILADFVAEAMRKSQVVIATQSPELLDAISDAKPAISVFEWVGDHTEIGTLSGEELQKWIADYSLGRFAFSGEAEAIL